MIDARIAGAALCRAVAFVALVLAGSVGLAVLWGEPTLAFLCSLFARLLAGLAGRDWAGLVAALAAAGAVFVALSTPALILLLWQCVGK